MLYIERSVKYFPECAHYFASSSTDGFCPECGEKLLNPVKKRNHQEEEVRRASNNNYIDITSGLQMNPNEAHIWLNKGNDLANLAKYNEAVECYDKALKTNPSDVDAWENKGLALVDLAKYEDSIECYNKANL